MKPPKYLKIQNPKAQVTDEFVLHTQSPALLAQLLTLEKAKGKSNLYRIGKTDTYLWVVDVYQEATPEQVKKVMSRMAEWFYYQSNPSQ